MNGRFVAGIVVVVISMALLAYFIGQAMHAYDQVQKAQKEVEQANLELEQSFDELNQSVDEILTEDSIT